jgi:hypothetical protein
MWTMKTNKTIHLNDDVQRCQARLLEALPAVYRESIAYIFRIGNVCDHYYNEVGWLPTELDFYRWMDGLPEKVAVQMRTRGYEKCKNLLALRLNADSHREAALEEYLKAELSRHDYQRWSAETCKH